MTAADEYRRLLDEHLPAFECDGDYGEMQWVECSCGSEYFVDTDAGYSEHRAHLAQALAADPGVRAAVEREVLERAAQAIEASFDHAYDVANEPRFGDAHMVHAEGYRHRDRQVRRVLSDLMPRKDGDG